jgi:hypothetical protein
MSRRLYLALALAAVILLIKIAPLPTLAAIKNLTAFTDALLILASLFTLLFFVYRIFLRKMFRARRIANLRHKRALDSLPKP